MSVKDTYSVKEINYNDCKYFILKLHYAQRMPSISYSYGLFAGKSLIGVLTIGKPASNSLCKGVCGEEYSSKVYELNRLIVLDGLEKNALSYFVSTVLKELKAEDLIIISYADEGMNHNGYIYQATNFIYTGKTKRRTDKYTEDNKHSRHYTDENKHLRKIRTPKHRYIYFTANRNKYLKLLKYDIQEYPKGENHKYKLGDRMKAEIYNKQTNETTYI